MITANHNPQPRERPSSRPNQLRSVDSIRYGSGISAFLASRAVFPHMQNAGGGAIVNFARAGLPQANMLAYNCAKAGIEALTRTLALEGRDSGIRVNAVAPGLVDTASNIAAMKPKDLKRWTKRSDIAETVVFLASEGAAGITGQVIAVTGWGL